MLSQGRGLIDAEDLSEGVLSPISSTEERVEPGILRNVLTLAEMEADYIQKVLTSVGGNKSKAARLLGISRKNLYDREVGRRNETVE